MVYCDGYCCVFGKPVLPKKIKGNFFHCKVCPDFDLCQDCHNKFKSPGWCISYKLDNCHPADSHAFKEIKQTKKRSIKKKTKKRIKIKQTKKRSIKQKTKKRIKKVTWG